MHTGHTKTNVHIYKHYLCKQNEWKTAVEKNESMKEMLKPTTNRKPSKNIDFIAFEYNSNNVLIFRFFDYYPIHKKKIMIIAQIPINWSIYINVTVVKHVFEDLVIFIKFVCSWESYGRIFVWK